MHQSGLIKQKQTKVWNNSDSSLTSILLSSVMMNFNKWLNLLLLIFPHWLRWVQLSDQSFIRSPLTLLSACALTRVWCRACNSTVKLLHFHCAKNKALQLMLSFNQLLSRVLKTQQIVYLSDRIHLQWKPLYWITSVPSPFDSIIREKYVVVQLPSYYGHYE